MLDYILNPIAVDDFLANYFEKKYLLINRQNKDYFKTILRVDMLDKLLFSTDLYHPEVRVVDNAKDNILAGTYTVKNSKRIDPIKFARHYAEGSTLVFSMLHRSMPELRQLTHKVGHFFKLPFQTNIYLTPENSQGFAPHYDTHDVFILQFAGNKVWRIYDSGLLLADRTQEFKKDFKVGNIVDEFTLYQGDTLYIPRGLMHDAFCENSLSGHITLGLIGNTWAECLADLILNQSKEHIALRKHPKFYNPKTKEKGLKEIKELINHMVDNLEGNDLVLNDYYAKQRPPKPSMLMNMEQLKTLNAQSIIKIREKNQIRLSNKQENIELLYYDLKISLPIISSKTFIDNLMASHEGISIENIQSDLDEESRLLLCRELIKNGIVEVVYTQIT